MQASTKHTIYLSFDTEEFDLPKEYGIAIAEPQQMEIGYRGLEAVQEVMEATGVTATYFTTAHFAQHYPQAIYAIAQQHEIASHTYYHSHFEEADLLNSKIALESITGKPVLGLRMPRFKRVSTQAITDAGYSYDSSIHPTYIPGRYNNLRLPRKPHMKEQLMSIPVSVTPACRIPLFWLAFKNLPYPLYRHLLLRTLKQDGFVCLYFHPWEFTNLISAYAVPGYTKRAAGKVLLQKLHRLITDLQSIARFECMQHLTLP